MRFQRSWKRGGRRFLSPKKEIQPPSAKKKEFGVQPPVAKKQATDTAAAAAHDDNSEADAAGLGYGGGLYGRYGGYGGYVGGKILPPVAKKEIQPPTAKKETQPPSANKKELEVKAPVVKKQANGRRRGL
ncbi:hypothetical protein DFJ73DRAFT_780252 [Zopfochytrium polystomum]|nr:hypothetical protein DFJ73DRAFT_780252 [Zopfochytrium polystomum]